jgi:hypothetical protein
LIRIQSGGAFFTGIINRQALSAQPNRSVRAFGLFWARLGKARIGVGVIAGVVIALAGLGLWSLLSPPKKIVAPAGALVAPPLSQASPTVSALARVAAGVGQSSPNPSAVFSPTATPQLEHQVAITGVEEAEKRGRQGETFVIATIGLASRTNVEKNGVEIHVYFYDLTPNNQMRPTDAQVTYQWLTPVRDWSDPAPKYLAATYFKGPMHYRSMEQLRYGGFVVRVFSGGKLQDERSQPEGLLSLFHSNATERSASPSIAPAASLPPQKTVAVTKITPLPSASPTAPDTALPYGKPVPGKPGFVSSPYDPKFLIDVRGFPPGTLVNDPNTNKPFRVP